jgi:hypothetical protein
LHWKTFMLKSGFSCLSFALLGTAASALSHAAGAAAAVSPAAGAAVVAANAVSGVASRLAGTFGTKFVRRTAERYFAHWGAIDEHDVLIRELRRAQLRALWKVLLQFEKARATDPDAERQAQGDTFCEYLRKFLDEETANVEILTWAGVDGTTDQENALRRQVLECLPEGFDESLGVRHHAGLKTAAETVVLEELRRLVFEDIPPLFRSAFESGQSGHDGWFDLFTRDAAARLKAGGEFERIWNAEQTSVIRRIAQEIGIRVDAITEWLPQANAALRAFGAGLDAMAGDLQAITIYTKAVYDRACGDRALPLDFDEQVSTTGTRRFSPLNPRLSFVGRQLELAALEAFLAAELPHPFAWWLVVGGGGAGKTKLARQLCLRAHLLGWRAGFLPKEYTSNLETLQNWRPQYPTLIVADYVMSRVEDIRRLTGRLARRNDLPPVRLLLLEREGGQFFDDVFLGPDQSDSSVIEGSRYQPPTLVLPELSEDDLWTLVRSCPWREDGKCARVWRQDFFTRLDVLDRQRRALVAMVLADAYAADPNRTGFDSLDAELRDLLRRNRSLLWPRQLHVADRPIGAVEADVVIAFATMIGGLGLSELTAMEDARSEFIDRTILPACGRAVGKPITGAELARLEPDLIGEFFVLETLGGDPDNPFLDPPHGWMPELAWNIRGGATRDFVFRAIQNFPQHRALGRIAVTVKNVAESWVAAAVRASTVPGTALQISAVGIQFLRENARSDPAAAMALGAFWMLPDTTASGRDFTLSAALIGDLDAVLLAHPNEPPVRDMWAKAVRIVISRHLPTDPVGSRRLLDYLATLHGAYPDEAQLREQWAACAQRFILNCVGAEPMGCRDLLDELAALHHAHPAEPLLREEWARSVTTYINHRYEKDSHICHDLLDQLAASHAAHPDESRLRHQWAIGVECFLRSGKNPDDYELLCRLGALHAAHPDEPPLREAWAEGVKQFVTTNVVSRPDLCRALIENLTAMYAGCPAEPRLRELWAITARWFYRYHLRTDPEFCTRFLAEIGGIRALDLNNPSLRGEWAITAAEFIYHRAALDPVDSRRLLDELFSLHAAHPEEPALRERWASSVNFFVGRRGADEPTACGALLDDLATVHTHYPNEPVLRGNWATAAVWFISHRSAEDLSHCRALLSNLAALCLSHPTETVLRKEWMTGVTFWARGAASFILHHAADDPNNCLTILSDLDALRVRHPNEPSIRENYGSGVAAFILGRATDDLPVCRALLNHLAVLSDNHADEPAIRENRAKGVAWFVLSCASQDPTDCHALLDDLAVLHAAYPQEPLLREIWAEGVRNFMICREVRDRVNCQTLLDALSALCVLHHSEHRLDELRAECVHLLSCTDTFAGD